MKKLIFIFSALSFIAYGEGLNERLTRFDPFFGVFGILEVKQIKGTIIKSVVLDSGKILTLLAPISGEPRNSIRVVQMLSNGTIDETFGQNGIAKIEISEGSKQQFRPSDLLLDKDRRIYIAGSYYISSPYESLNSFVIRFKSNGEIDSSFGNSGIAVHDKNVSRFSNHNRILIDKKGRVLMVASTGEENHERHFVTRFLSDGSLDLSFGENGSWISPIDGAHFTSLGFALDSKDGIYFGSSNYYQKRLHSYLLHLDSHGILNPEFGKGGIIENAFPVSANIDEVRLDNLGRIVIAGSWMTEDPSGNPSLGLIDSFVARFTDIGELDKSFHNTGFRLYENKGWDACEGLELDSQGRLILFNATLHGITDPYTYTFVRFTPEGNYDNSFGYKGTFRFEDQKINSATFTLTEKEHYFITADNYGYDTAIFARIIPD